MTMRFGCLQIALLALSATAVFAQEAKTQQAPLVIGTKLGYPPYSFLDENGQAAGYNVDLTRAIAKTMGLDIKIRIGPWSEIREALETGEIDAVAGMFHSAKRDELVDFLPPYTIIQHAIFACHDTAGIATVEDLRDKDIIVMRGDIMHDYVLDNGLCATPVLVDTQAEALRLLASGKHDCALLAKLPGLYWARELKLSNIVTVGPLLRPSNYCYAVTEGNAELRRQLGEGMSILGETGARKEIYDKWLGVLQPRGVPLSTVLLYVGFVAIPLVLLLTLFAVWSRTLKKQVARRTQDLSTSEERKELALRGANLGTWDWHMPTDNMTFDERWAGMLGYTLDEIEQRLSAWEKLVHPEDMPGVQKKLSAHLEGETEFYESEFRMKHKSGRWIWVLDRGKVIARDADGRPLRACGTHLDITNHKQLEEDRDRVLHDLDERVKELQCTYGVANSIRERTDLRDIFLDVCQLIPPSSQYPEITRCRVRFDGVEYISKGFKETSWMLSRDIEVDGVVRGGVDVCHLKQIPKTDEEPFLNEERELLDGISLILGQTIERAEAAAENQAYQEQLSRLGARQVIAEEQQRRLIAADLHDRVGQTLVAAKVEAGLLRRSLTPANDLASIDRMLAMIDQTMRDVWSLTFELCPPMLYEAGLEAALEWLAKQFAERHDIACRLVSDGDTQSLSDELRGLLFHTSRELLANVSKHGRATDVEIKIIADGESLRVCVTDNGVGFDRLDVDKKDRDASGFGLFSIRERLRHFNGKLDIDSKPGQGARITMTVPLCSVEKTGEK